MEFETFINSLTESYYKKYPSMKRIPTTIILSENITQTHCELRTDLRERLLNDVSQNDNNDCNGRIVLPSSIDEPIYILLNTQKIIQYTKDKTMTWIGTFAHELTHAIDFYIMARKENLISYDVLQEIKLYEMFQLWSEYHARKLGYGFLRHFFLEAGELVNPESDIRYIKEIEWPHHLDIHYKEYHNPLTSGNHQRYITMQLLGRYSVWCDIYPESFNIESISETFSGDAWMVNLFRFLYNHETLDKIYPCFEEMHRVFEENWPM